jgi:hypothetical protein
MVFLLTWEALLSLVHAAFRTKSFDPINNSLTPPIGPNLGEEDGRGKLWMDDGWEVFIQQLFLLFATRRLKTLLL